MKINRDIRAPKVRVISKDGDQIGVIAIKDALALAQEDGLDLVEISPNAEPPVCKIIDYGKFRYNQTKKEREGKKTQHQVKIKEIKLTPNITEHDLEIKMKKAIDFLDKGCKVKVSCFFKGREVMHADRGNKLVVEACRLVEGSAVVESSAKMTGRTLALILAPCPKKKK